MVPYAFKGWFRFADTGRAYRAWTITEARPGIVKGCELSDRGPTNNDGCLRFAVWNPATDEAVCASDAIADVAEWFDVSREDVARLVGEWPPNADALPELTAINRRLDERSLAERELAEARVELTRLAADVTRYLQEHKQRTGGDEEWLDKLKAWSREPQNAAKADRTPATAPDAPEYLQIARKVLPNGPGRSETRVVNGERRWVTLSEAPHCYVFVAKQDIAHVGLRVGDVLLILHTMPTKSERAQIRGIAHPLPRSRFRDLLAAWDSLAYAESSWSDSRNNDDADARDKVEAFVRAMNRRGAAKWKDETSRVLIVRPWGVEGLTLTASSDADAAAALILEVGGRPTAEA